MANTPIRGLRIPEDIWRAAQERAEREGTTVTEVVRRYLARWVKR